MKKTILLLMTLFVSFTFIQCKRCKQKDLGSIKFTQTDLNIVPYNGSETLIFKDSLGDSLIFTGKTRWLENNIKSEYAVEQEEDCAGDYYHIDEYNIRFFSPNFYPYFSFRLDFGNPFANDHNKYMDIIVSYSQYWSFENTFAFDNLKFDNSSSLAFNDSLSIGPHKYSTVYTLMKAGSNISTVYYTVSKGVVGFKNNQNLLWFLDK